MMLERHLASSAGTAHWMLPITRLVGFGNLFNHIVYWILMPVDIFHGQETLNVGPLCPKHHLFAVMR